MALVDRIARGVKASFGATLLDLASNAALVLILTRVLFTPAEYGQLNFTLSALGVVTVLATLGLPRSAARYVTEFTETDPGQVRYVIRRSAIFLTAMVALVAVATVVAGPAVVRLTNSLGVTDSAAVGGVLFVGAFYVAGRAYKSYLTTIFQGLNRVDWSATVTAVSSIARLPLVVGLVVLGFGVAGAVAGYVLAFALASLLGSYVVYTRFYREYDEASAASEGLTRRLLEYSVPLTATRGANVLDKKVDTLLLGVIVDMTAVGYYTVAKQVSDFVAAPASSFGYTISPALGEQSSKDRAERAASLYQQSLEYVLIGYVPALVGLVLVAEPTIRYVFGSDYLSSVLVLQVFSGFMLVNAINKVTSDGLDYLGRARSRAIVKSVTAVGNVCLNLLLIPQMGAVGAAVATVITYTVYTGSNVYFIVQELPIDLWRVVRLLGVVALVTVGMAAVVVGALPYVSGLPSLLGVVALGGGMWAALSVLGGLLSVKQVRDQLV
ncbi:flippase (plasmid) [Halolamina sp. CBA1230]|uniref:flippase n=1 Tax=Halolamina sp. CBA1230 TaxID=1853690 RepID=UPI001594A47C|nr:flippase [Halolamina sp. CBA1230]QKY21976.1 flippase [Halolamina sp. CBA1230]